MKKQKKAKNFSHKIEKLPAGHIMNQTVILLDQRKLAIDVFGLIMDLHLNF